MFTAFCDASFSGDGTTAVIGVVCGNKLIRKYVKARNSTHAELIAVLVARKVFGNDVVCVTDNELVSSILRKSPTRRRFILNRTFGLDDSKASYEKVVAALSSAEIIWARRRSNDQLRIADNLTRDCTLIGWNRYLTMGYKFVTMV